MLRTKRLSSAALALGLMLGGCTNTELTVPGNHPGNANAEAAKVTTTSALKSDFEPAGAASESDDDSHQHQGHGHDHGAQTPSTAQHGQMPAPSEAQDKAPGEVIYTCPMHPEIQRKEPGNCPICGMKLVPKKDKK